MYQIYDRLYYTIYRLLISFGQIGPTDIPRINTAVLLSLFMGVGGFALFALISVIIGTPIIIDSKWLKILFSILVVAVNSLFIFYRRRYMEIEERLSLNWEKEKNKNIWMTIIFIIATVCFIWWTFYYIKSHPLTRK